MLDVFLLLAFICLGHECHDLSSPCACVHTVDLGLYSSERVLAGLESQPMLTPSEKSPPPEAQRRVEHMSLHHAGQQAQHTTD